MFERVSADRRRRWVRGVPTLLAVVAIGCGGGEDLPETAPVTGVVTYEGKPVEGATVMFHPKGGAATNPGGAYTDKDGRFSLTTYAKDDGAILGAHEVTVQLFDAMGEVKKIPGKYGDVKTSGLTATVQAGENDVPLLLSSSGK